MKKPSEIVSLEAKKNKWLCWPGYKYCMLFGTLYTRSERVLDEINKTGGIDSSDENHEMIHVRQAVSVKDSWLRFYFLYLCMWIWNIPLLFVNSHAPYKFIPFELEAYGNENDMNYLSDKDRCEEWRMYRKLTMKERRMFAKMYYKEKRYDFPHLVSDVIKPYLLERV